MEIAERRPTVVTAAYWLWFVAAVVCVLMGLAYLLVTEEALLTARENIDDVGGLVNLLRMYGGISLISGLFVGVLSGFARKGDPRFRRSLVAFSIMLAIFQIATISVSGFYAVAIVVPAITACVLVYRPAAQPWFER
ncbi:hypothetical protein [Hoyosella altamirensis]|uniref:Uncharacterized membrane protein (UPF0136 family) n=1 Tax=Hoyosella altamirensis TaxID=616997 RepID=A0A839RN30_9ACTN|nr:hypothetical protein [Hoyosella altamirensis]MBB3037476.1 uncharacterized membrane protein (UPF0136 family) [Hoyosella altamirensis]